MGQTPPFKVVFFFVKSRHQNAAISNLVLGISALTGKAVTLEFRREKMDRPNTENDAKRR